MSAFYFQFIDNDGQVATEDAFEFRDMIAAVDEAKIVLAEMALDGIPQHPYRAFEIEVQNAERTPIVRMTLELKIEYLQSEY